MTWSDEFDGGAIDESVWTFDTGNGHPAVPGWGNEEPQYYQRENAWVEDGHLVIEAREEHVTDEYGEYDYTSSRMKTQNAVEKRYGRVDVRARLPEGQGLWPAIWSLGANLDEVDWPNAGEIDIMELLGHEPATVHGAAHGPGYSGADGYGDSYTLFRETFTDSFHVFSIVWSPDRIEWYADGAPFHVLTRSDVENAGDQWVFDGPVFFLLNVACGGTWPGYPDESTEFPQRMEVDYIRHYETA